MRWHALSSAGCRIAPSWACGMTPRISLRDGRPRRRWARRWAIAVRTCCWPRRTRCARTGWHWSAKSPNSKAPSSMASRSSRWSPRMCRTRTSRRRCRASPASSCRVRRWTGSAAAKLLSSLRPEPGARHTEDDVFVTRTWKEEEPASQFADAACRKLAAQGFRLIGDEPRGDDDEERLRDIISSCAAYLALIPPREPEELQWLLKDLSVAKSCGLPIVILADPKTIALEAQGLLKTDSGQAVGFAGALAVIPADMTGGAPDRSGSQRHRQGGVADRRRRPARAAESAIRCSTRRHRGGCRRPSAATSTASSAASPAGAAFTPTTSTAPAPMSAQCARSPTRC